MYRDPFHAGILECLPRLRAFAYLLARNHASAEDLVQETAIRAISARDKFQPGTNLRGWLIIILRNCYFNEQRRMSFRLTDSLETCGIDPLASGGQEERLEMRDFERQLHQLPAPQREALLLIGVNGYSYEEAAAIAGCPVGTMKSRVSRARLQLQTALEGGRERPRRKSSQCLATDRGAESRLSVPCKSTSDAANPSNR